MRKGEIAYKYSLRVLEERLAKEKEYLTMFNLQMKSQLMKEENHNDWYIKHNLEALFAWEEECQRVRDYVNKNVESCTYRINELEETIIAILHLIEGFTATEISKKLNTSEEIITHYLEQIKNKKV